MNVLLLIFKGIIALLIAVAVILFLALFISGEFKE